VFDLSPEKIFILGILALVVLGPNRLPHAARTMGRVVGQLRSMSSSLQTEVREAMGEPGDAITAAIGEFRPSEVRRSVRQAVSSTLAPPTRAASADAAPPQSAAGPPAGPDDPSLN
jgi:sec-independent protein translocase protein TatB